MVIETYPVGANSGFSEESELDSERDRLISAHGGRMANHIVDPFSGGDFDITTSPSDFQIDIAGGFALMGGHLVENGTNITKTINPNTTSEVFLRVDDNPTGNAEIVAQDKSDADPNGDYVMRIWEVTTDGSGTTGTTDFREYVPFREDQTNRSVTGRKAGTSGTIPIDSVGIQTVSVTFSQPYQNSADQANCWVNSLDDTGVDFQWWRVDPTTISKTGFTIEANINGAVGTNTTADFSWEAYGK